MEVFTTIKKAIEQHLGPILDKLEGETITDPSELPEYLVDVDITRLVEAQSNKIAASTAADEEPTSERVTVFRRPNNTLPKDFHEFGVFGVVDIDPRHAAYLDFFQQTNQGSGDMIV